MRDKPEGMPSAFLARRKAANPEPRYTADSITDDALDELYDRVTAAEQKIDPAALTEQYAAAIRPVMLIGLQDAELVGEPGAARITEWADWIAAELARTRIEIGVAATPPGSTRTER
ncbi:hypothetical protein [Streptomyces sp. NPDC093109]|uniref:hypothetical protein n=1 Tax=Streptomyces sp. NPDC093109 TaxID=3154977 RepID=UPI00344D231B